MVLRWTEEAADDLEVIADYLFERTPELAPNLVLKLYNSPAALAIYPYRGRIGQQTGTREFVTPGLPYVIVYRIHEEVIEIVRILHGAQKWP